jgi:hypothetical protein
MSFNWTLFTCYFLIAMGYLLVIIESNESDD